MNDQSIIKLTDGNIKGNIREILWVAPDSVANRVRYYLWGGFIDFLLKKKGLKIDDLSLISRNSIKEIKQWIYEVPHSCFKLQELLIPVVKEIVSQ